jgi:hypothetical protein
MLQLFYLDVAYVSHTCYKRMSQMLYLFQMYVAFECFILQVQTTNVVVDEGKQGQARPLTCAGGVGRRHRRCGEEAQAVWCCCGRGWGESSRRPERDERRAGVEVAGASHPRSVSSGSEADSSDLSVETELARAAGESEQTGRSSHGHSDVGALVL